jgi:hypothetical protein
MAISLTPRQLEQVPAELSAAPLADVLARLAEAVAEGQAKLDLASAEVMAQLATTMVKIVPEVRQIIEADGTRRFERADPVELSLLDIGLRPTFYAFAEATAEVAMDLKIVEEVSGGTTTRPALLAATQALRTERRLNRDVRVSTRITAKLVPVPGPASLGPVTSVEDRREGGGS